MPLSFAFFTFVNAWWIMLFFAVPFSVHYSEEGDAPDAMRYAAAPKSIHWKKAFTIAAVLAFIVTLALALLFKSGIVPLHNL